jgi:hypothetical protein
MVDQVVPYLLTYPRSGSNYFDDILYKQEKIHFIKSHYIENFFDKNNYKIITIARDPIDSICSQLSLYQDLDLTRGHDFTVIENITNYILMYSFLCENADYVIDFNDLIKYPELVIKKLLESLNIDKDKYYLFNQNFMPKHKNFIRSSKSLSRYRNDFLDDFNTDICYFYYHKLLEKKIII